MLQRELATAFSRPRRGNLHHAVRCEQAKKVHLPFPHGERHQIRVRSTSRAFPAKNPRHIRRSAPPPMSSLPKSSNDTCWGGGVFWIVAVGGVSHSSPLLACVYPPGTARWSISDKSIETVWCSCRKNWRNRRSRRLLAAPPACSAPCTDHIIQHNRNCTKGYATCLNLVVVVVVVVVLFCVVLCCVVLCCVVLRCVVLCCVVLCCVVLCCVVLCCVVLCCVVLCCDVL